MSGFSIYDTESDSIYGGCDYGDDNITKERLRESGAMPAVTRLARDYAIAFIVIMENCGAIHYQGSMVEGFNDDQMIDIAVDMTTTKLETDGAGNSLHPDEVIELCDFEVVKSNCRAMLTHIRETVKGRMTQKDRLGFAALRAAMG